MARRKPKSQARNSSKGNGELKNRTRSTDRTVTRNAPAEKSERTNARLSSLNDISWYARNPLLLQTAAQIPYALRPGMSVHLGEFTPQDEEPFTFYDASYAIPGVVTLNYRPTIGYATSVTDPASLAAKEMYTQVRKAFSGTLVCDAPDLMIYMLALDSIFMNLAKLKRIYRVLNAYSPSNFITPQYLLYALGFTVADPTASQIGVIEDLRAHAPLFLQRINELVAMTRKFFAPAIMDILNRHYWMNDNVYMDKPSSLGQFYVMDNIGYFQFDTTEEGIGKLTMKTWSTLVNQNAETTSPGFSVDLLIKPVLQQIEVLANSEDAYTISGYFQRAYEGVAPFVVEYLLPDEPFEPVYVPEVLSQIENARVYTPVYSGTNWDVLQEPSTNALIHKPTVDPQGAPGFGSYLREFVPVINLHVDVPTVQDTVIASRLQAALIGDFSSTSVEAHAGTEIITTMTLYAPGIQGAGAYYKSCDLQSIVYNDMQRQLPVADIFVRTLQATLRLSAFDWHPLITFITFHGDAEHTSTSVIGDVHNLTTLTNQQLAEINRVCLLSEFNAYSMF